MKAVIGFAVLMVSAVTSDMAGECDMVAFYTELGCTPLPQADNSTKCPDAFNCPDLHPDSTKCYYRGVSYNDRAMIPQNLIINPCSKLCTCRVSGTPSFECAEVDCVEYFDSDMQQQCINTYELDKCCSTGNVCGKDAIAKLKTCDVDGKTYKEGEQFWPKNTRKICICTSDWSGSTDNDAYCKDINCGIEIHYQDNLQGNCAPVFSGNERSCPIAFQCPSSSSKVIRGLNLRTVSSQCVFGNMTLGVGDEVTVEEKCMKCSCDVPPFVSCTKENVCD